jgi:hypothetical protein
MKLKPRSDNKVDQRILCVVVIFNIQVELCVWVCCWLGQFSVETWKPTFQWVSKWVSCFMMFIWNHLFDESLEIWSSALVILEKLTTLCSSIDRINSILFRILMVQSQTSIQICLECCKKNLQSTITKSNVSEDSCSPWIFCRNFDMKKLWLPLRSLKRQIQNQYFEVNLIYWFFH